MSADKYPSIFSRQMKAIVYIVIARSIFVVHTQRIPCDIRKFVCREKKLVGFPAFFSNKRRKLCFVFNC